MFELLKKSILLSIKSRRLKHIDKECEKYFEIKRELEKCFAPDAPNLSVKNPALNTESRIKGTSMIIGSKRPVHPSFNVCLILGISCFSIGLIL